MPEKIGEYFKIMKETDELYDVFQKYSGLSDAEYWSLVAVRIENCQYQHEISKSMSMSRQTVNSALKHLMERGYIVLEVPKENQRIKKVVFTEEGEKFAQKYLDVINKSEEKAWSLLSEDERKSLLYITMKLKDILADEIKNCIKL